MRVQRYHLDRGIIVLFFLTFIIGSVFSSNFYFKDSLTLLGSFDDNVYYYDQGRKGDFLLTVDPALYVSYKVNELELALDGDYSYNQYFSETNLSNFSSNSSAIVKLNPDKRTKIELIQGYIDSSDPPISDGSDTNYTDTADRYNWVQNRFIITTKYKSDSTFWSIDASFENYKTNYKNPTFNNLDNNSYFFTLTNYFSFLPETSLLLGLKTGFNDYIFPDNEYYSNSDSTHYEVFTGIKGRLTNTVTLFLKFGYLWLDYITNTDYHEPVIHVEFQDLFSQVSSATAGYERMAYDSTYSNFYVDNKLFMNFKSIFYDRLINLITVQYIYRYYWTPNNRVDNRLGLISELTYPLTTVYGKNVSVIATVSYEWVTSDAYNAIYEDVNGVYTFRALGPDPSVDYKRLFVSLGLTTKY